MNRVMDHIGYIFNDIVTIPRLTIGLGVLFIFMAVVTGFFNATSSSIARAKHAEKKMRKFYAKNGKVDYYNAILFRKKCINSIGGSVVKVWQKFEREGVPIQNTKFEYLLRERVSKGGSVGFAIYLYTYIAVMAVLVGAMMVSNLPQEISSVYVCVCLVVGAIGMFSIGLQLYIMDKRIGKRVESIVSMVYEQTALFQPKKVVPIPFVPDKPAVVFTPSATKIVNSDQERIDAIREMIAMIGINPQPTSDSAMTSTATQASLPHFEKINTRMITPEDIEKPISADAIDNLNTLIEDILSKGGNQELLACVQKALMAICDIRYARPVDDMRMKCIIKKLDRVI